MTETLHMLILFSASAHWTELSISYLKVLSLRQNLDWNGPNLSLIQTTLWNQNTFISSDSMTSLHPHAQPPRTPPPLQPVGNYPASVSMSVTFVHLWSPKKTPAPFKINNTHTQTHVCPTYHNSPHPGDKWGRPPSVRLEFKGHRNCFSGVRGHGKVSGSPLPLFSQPHPPGGDRHSRYAVHPFRAISFKNLKLERSNSIWKHIRKQNWQNTVRMIIKKGQMHLKNTNKNKTFKD